jgi:hypothetical protein
MGFNMAIRLTPDRLRRIVLEEKKKIETKQAKPLDKKALKDLQMEMDEESWHNAKPPAAKSYKPGDKPMGAGATMKEMHELQDLREQEEILRNRLKRLQERRLAVRKQIISKI